MTTLIVPPTVSQPISVVVAAPDLAANIRDSQAAGDLAYALAEQAGLGKPELWEAYHVTFVESMRALGTPMPCACLRCLEGGIQ